MTKRKHDMRPPAPRAHELHKCKCGAPVLRPGDSCPNCMSGESLAPCVDNDKRPTGKCDPHKCGLTRGMFGVCDERRAAARAGTHKPEPVEPPGERLCVACGESKPLSEFGTYGRNQVGESYYRTRCKPCHNKRQRECDQQRRQRYAAKKGVAA
jgi:hypothetical protein